jgi:hypothetical protein
MANSLGEQVVHDKLIDIFGHFHNLVYYIDWWDYMVIIFAMKNTRLLYSWNPIYDAALWSLS